MGFNLFTWWCGQTFGTWAKTAFRGREVGRDEVGNIYYEHKRGDDGGVGKRWVLYGIDNDSSHVPPDWHLWLHRVRDTAPSEEPLPVREWEKPWRANPTGSALAELPPGALAAGGKRSPAAADYRPWIPGEASGEAGR